MSTSKLQGRDDNNGKHPTEDLRPSRNEVTAEAAKKITLFKAAKFAIARNHGSSSKILA